MKVMAKVIKAMKNMFKAKIMALKAIMAMLLNVKVTVKVTKVMKD